jgi:hypothetical protein
MFFCLGPRGTERRGVTQGCKALGGGGACENGIIILCDGETEKLIRFWLGTLIYLNIASAGRLYRPAPPHVPNARYLVSSSACDSGRTML